MSGLGNKLHAALAGALLGSAARAAPLGAWPRTPNGLAPNGPMAEAIAGVWWFLLVVAAAVFVVVTALLVVALLRRGREVTDGGATGDAAVRPLLLLGTALTAAVLLVVAVVAFRSMGALAAPAEDPALALEIVGKRWWWEIRYDGEVIGANEIHVPVGTPVLLRLRSADVIHSFWVPELAGKRDLIPGRTNTLWLQADEAGVYRGQCAEYCGLQHAHMGLLVVAEPRPAFEAWLRRARAPADPPSSDAARAGRAVFTREGCAGCHAVRGTAAHGELGPDLTHLASRRSLAAATVPNTKGHLAGWIVNPWAIKPGVAMPPQDLRGEDLQRLLDYLSDLD